MNKEKIKIPRDKNVRCIFSNEIFVRIEVHDAENLLNKSGVRWKNQMKIQRIIIYWNLREENLRIY